MIEASVWIAPSIWNWVSDLTARSVAETTPTESERCSPKGLPIAATGSPTSSSLSLPSSSGWSAKPSGSTFSRATSANGSKPRIFASSTLRFENSTKTSSAGMREPFDSSVTTWALVTISPFSSSTKPEPSAPPAAPKTERIVTTPGEASAVDLGRVEAGRGGLDRQFGGTCGALRFGFASPVAHRLRRCSTLRFRVGLVLEDHGRGAAAAAGQQGEGERRRQRQERRGRELGAALTGSP